MAWSAGTVDRTAWFRSYADTRYGGADAGAESAWAELAQGPYAMPSGSWAEPQDSLFTARPSLTASSTASWSPGSLRYDPSTVRSALTSLLNAVPARKATDAYRFDVVNLARQALADRSRALLPQISAAYGRKDLTAFRALVTEWNGDEAALDQLLAADPRFLTGGWLAGVDAWGATDTERGQLRYDARSIITTPGTVVQLYSCNGTPAQSWTPRSDGTLQNLKSGLCLDASGGGSAPGTALIIWTCTASANQRWTLPG
nr:alpha-N-acetylglucosaminidase C-terminal domain-containing protein [Kitasatospora sp. MMS16-BH015]